MVSSTAIPNAIVKMMLVLIFRSIPVADMMAETASRGNKLGMSA